MSILIVPGYQGSGKAHWQTWLQQEFPDSRRLVGVDWQRPVLYRWARAIGDELRAAREPVVVVAHSFGCLAAALAVKALPGKVAAAVLVAPADPQRFSVWGKRTHWRALTRGLDPHLPTDWLGVPGVLVGSQNDPWMAQADAQALAERWGLAFQDAGRAGHINADSGYGPWPWIANLLRDRGLCVSSVYSARRRPALVQTEAQILAQAQIPISVQAQAALRFYS